MTLPSFDWRFVAWAALGGMGQIIATSLLIYTFELRNFTVGTAYSKTETIQIALFGYAVPRCASRLAGLGQASSSASWACWCCR